MADGDYGSGNYSDGLYGSGIATAGYGSGLYGDGPYGLAAAGGNNLFGPPAKKPKPAPRRPRSIDRATTDDDEAALALVLALL